MNENKLIERLHEIRMEANLSARELSLRIGKYSNYIHKLENGLIENIPYSVVYDIITCCGKSVEEFFYDDYKSYKVDKEILKLLSKYPKNKKELLLQFLND